MNLMRDQSDALEQLRNGEGHLATSTAARTLASGVTDQPLLRLDILRSLQLHRKLALGVVLAGILLAVAYLLSLWPIYTAQALIYIQPAPPRVMDSGNAMARWPFDTNTYDTYIAQQVASMTRPDVLTNALHKLDPGSWQKKTENDQAAAERLGKTIEVGRMGTTYQVSITARASKAALAAKLANAVAASYLESASKEIRSGDKERLAMLRQEKENVQKELAADRAEQLQLNKQLGVQAVANGAPALLDEDLSRVHDELVKARAASDEAAAKLVSLNSGKASDSVALDAEADKVIAEDPGLSSLKVTLFQRRGNLVSQMSNLTPNNPQFKQDTEELAKIDKSLESVQKDLRAKASVRIQQRLHTDLDRTAGVESRLNSQLGQLSAAAAGATPKMQRLNDLGTDIVRLQSRYSTVEEQFRNLTMDDSVPSASYLAAAALPPLHATRSSVLRNSAVIALAGIFLALGVAVGANKLDQKVYIASDVEQVLGFKPMAVLPDFQQVSDGVAEEHMLRLAAGIDYARQQGNLKSCIFTGTDSGTGTTTVATRVRSMLDAMGRSTVLVDASGTPPPPPQSRPGSGPHEAPNQLAAQRGSRSTAILQELEDESQEESLVLTDTAPLAVSAETEYLARFVDAAIVVVESGVTTRTQLRDTATTLQRLDVAAVGFVLNRVGLEKADAAFRKSVRAVEQHLRAQSRSYSRRTERSRPRPAAAPPAEEMAKEEAPAPPAEAKVKQPIVTPAPASHTAAPHVPELAAATPVEQLPFRQRVPRTPRVEEYAEAAVPAAEAFIHQRSQARQAEIPLPVEPEPSVSAPQDQETIAVPPFRPRESQGYVAVPPLPVASVPVREPEPAPAPTPGPAPVARPYVSAPPEQSWERVSNRFDEIKPQPAQQPVQQAPDQAEPPYDAATRMSGLRSLIFSLGQKNVNRPTETWAQEAQAQPPALPPQERAAYARPYTPAPVPQERPAYAHPYAPVEPPQERPPYARPYPPPPDRQDRSDPSSTLVTAPPEFLPPKPMVETTEADSDRTWTGGTSAARRDRRDAYDDVDILPSWRGQYKKKKK